MRSRTTRLTLGTAVWLALGAVAAFLIHSEQQISQRQSALRAFDQQARETIDVLARARAGQQAYVAEGQGSGFWMPEVEALITSATASVNRLQETGVSPEGIAALEDARGRLTQFTDVDKRARGYLREGQLLMAGDVIFMEGGGSAALAARQVQAAALAEHQAVDTQTTRTRRLEAGALAGAGIFSALVVTLLAFSRSTTAPAAAESDSLSLSVREAAPASSIAEAPKATPPGHDVLTTAAAICTDIGRVNHPTELTAVLGRAADALTANGLIVWLGDAAGGDLRPVLAHGYPASALARMPAIPRSADNAVAAAYRTGAFQTAAAPTAAATGALIAPLVSATGCVGALTAEVRDGRETSPHLQALAALIAAQLAGVLAPADLPATDSGSAKTAAG